MQFLKGYHYERQLSRFSFSVFCHYFLSKLHPNSYLPIQDQEVCYQSQEGTHHLYSLLSINHNRFRRYLLFAKYSDQNNTRNCMGIN